MAETLGQDQPVSSQGDLGVITAINAARHESWMAKRTRRARSRITFGTYLEEQDWSGKQRGQSTEFLPKVSTAVEQFSAFIKRGLVQFGDWYSMDLSEQARQVLTPEKARRLLNCYLKKLPVGNLIDGHDTQDFSTLVADGVKLASLESLMILKIGGQTIEQKQFFSEPGQLTLNEAQGRFEQGEEVGSRTINPWRLDISLVRMEDYFPDPKGHGLYEIHEVERDYHDVLAKAEAGIYDLDVVRAMEGESAERKLDDRRRPSKMHQDEEITPSFRKRVVIREFWGTLLNPNGTIAHRNIVAAVANQRWLIRKPEPNPFWHGRKPFVAAPLIRVPFSVWHKALFDSAADLNIAVNELFNLMLDGGIASVWGIKQLRINQLENPSQVEGGIPQGTTLLVKDTLPPNTNVLDKVAEGEIPGDAFQLFEALGREFTQAALTNELKLGQLPPKKVLATEIIEASQSQAVTLDSIVADLENESIEKTLELSWLTLMQHLGDVLTDEVVEAVGARSALALARMTPGQRFALFANGCSFKVHGLSATLARVRDFQKTMALLQAVISNPLLLQSFVKRFSPDRTLDTLMRQLNINPTTIELDEQERAALGQTMQELPFFQQFTNQSGGGNANGGGQGLSAEQVGEPELPAEINQAGNPLSGLGAG